MTRPRCSEWDGFCGPIKAAGMCSRHYTRSYKAARHDPEADELARALRTKFAQREGSGINGLARLLGVRRVTVTNWASGDDLIPPKHRPAVARYIGWEAR